MFPISLMKKSKRLLNICSPAGRVSAIADPTRGILSGLSVVAKISLRNMRPARSCEIPQKRKSLRAVKCLWRMPTGTSRRSEIAFPIPRNTHTRSGFLRVIVKK